MISDNYHDIGRLLILTIIVDSKNWTISIIVKENITVNRQNQFIAHPYNIRTYIHIYLSVITICSFNIHSNIAL